MCGYLKDMIYALAASNCNMGAKAADIYDMCTMRTMICPLD